MSIKEVYGHKTHEVSSTKKWDIMISYERNMRATLLYERMIYVVKLKIWLYSMNYCLTNESQ